MGHGLICLTSKNLGGARWGKCGTAMSRNAASPPPPPFRGWWVWQGMERELDDAFSWWGKSYASAGVV